MPDEETVGVGAEAPGSRVVASRTASGVIAPDHAIRAARLPTDWEFEFAKPFRNSPHTPTMDRMRGKRIWVVLLASLPGLLGATGSGRASDVAEPQRSKLLVRSSIYGRVHKLRLVTTDGSKQNVYVVKGDEEINHGVSWNSDGTRFMFSVERKPADGGGVDLMKGRPEGKVNRVRRFTRRALRNPMWSATNRIFVWDTFEKFALVRPDGRTIMNGRWDYPGDFPLGWSPDGRRFLVEYEYCHQWEPECYGPSLSFTRFGSGTERGVAHGSKGSWSPDGRSIAHIDEGSLYVYSLDTHERVLVPTSTEVMSTPTWSPTGDRLAYASGGDLYAVDVDGETETQLTRGSYMVDSGPTWSPDGADIAFVRYKGFRRLSTDIYVIAADGTDVRQVTSSKLYENQPTWQPLPS